MLVEYTLLFLLLLIFVNSNNESNDLQEDDNLFVLKCILKNYNINELQS